MNDHYGCMLFGAYRTLISVKDAIILIHSITGCNWGTSTFHSPSKQSDLRQASTVIYENDLVFGGENNLDSSLHELSKLYKEQYIFVITGCIPEIMSDNSEHVLSNYNGKKKVFLVKAPGFKGNMDKGIQAAFMCLFDNMKPVEKIKNSVNLIGFFSDDYKADSDLTAIKKLLGKEIILNATIPYDNFNHIKNATRASLNLVFDGFEFAGKYMEEKFGIPFIKVDFPYGISGSEDFINKIHHALSIEKSLKTKKTLRSFKQIYTYLQKLQGMPIAISVDNVRSHALKSFLENELGMITKYTYNNELSNDKDNENNSEIHSGAVMIFGSSFHRNVADKLDIPLIRISYPIFDSINVSKRPYAGLEGALNLTEDIINALMSTKYRRSGMFG